MRCAYAKYERAKNPRNGKKMVENIPSALCFYLFIFFLYINIAYKMYIYIRHISRSLI